MTLVVSPRCTPTNFLQATSDRYLDAAALGVEPAVAIQRMRLIHGPGLAGDSTSNSSMNNIRFLEESHALAQRAWFELSKQYYDEVLDQLKRISLQLKSIDKKLGAR